MLFLDLGVVACCASSKTPFALLYTSKQFAYAKGGTTLCVSLFGRC